MKTITCIICLLFSQILLAQKLSTIKGKVFDSEKKQLYSATVSLLDKKDSSILKTALTNKDGMFEFTDVTSGPYILSVSSIGFKKHYQELTADLESIQLANIILENEAGALKEVRVSAKKPLIEQKIDRTIINVDAILSNAGVSALEVLENAPGIIIDNNGGISLKGKPGVVVFIDDKPSYLSGADLANYLKSLPSSSLDKIEIMTNPPARYDAAGNAGVINIKTKKTRAGGFNGGINAAYTQGKYPRTNNSFNFNYRNSKFNLFGTTSYALNNAMNDLDINRYYYQPNGSLRSTFFQNSFIRRTQNSKNLKIGFDYFLNSKTTIGLLFNGINRPSNSKTLNKSTVRNSFEQIDSTITADNKESGNWQNRSINLNLLHQYKAAGRNISFDLDYIVYNASQEQDFLNAVYAPNGNLKSTDGLTGDLPSKIKIYSGKTDYSHPLKSEAKIEAGAKISYVTTDNAANYFTHIDNVSKPDYDKTNHFLYDETINAGYLNFNKDWKYWSLQTGLRLEHTISDGHQLGNGVKTDSAFRRTYTNLFPTAYILHKFDSVSKNQVTLSYGRRIDRPFYQDLNPFISPLDKFSIYVGNPYLKPTITNVYELSHIFRNKITTTLSYTSTSNIIEETIDLSNSIYISRPANIGKSSVIGLSLSATLNPAKWWTNNIYAEGQKRHYEGLLYDYALDTSSYYFGTNFTSQFVLGKGWTAELSGFYRTAILVGQIISGNTGQINIGFGKKILDNKGSVKLNIRDIFYTRLNHGIITSIKNAYATYHNWGDSRSATISFSYNFGKAASQRNRNSGAEAEQNRVK